jgi:hypothetical protein
VQNNINIQLFAQGRRAPIYPSTAGARQARNRGSKYDKNLQEDNLMQAQNNYYICKHSSQYNKSRSHSIEHSAYVNE